MTDLKETLARPEGVGFFRHGHSRRSVGQTPTYQSWLSMTYRCRSSLPKWKERYSGRGITVCSRWIESYPAFLEDMGERPPKTTLDRIDNDGNYEPGNCRWATSRQQARNKSNTKLDVETATQIALAMLQGGDHFEIAARFNVSEATPRHIAKGRAWPDALEAAQSLLTGEA